MNKTQLTPSRVFERHVYHRDMFAHYFRWMHVLKYAKNATILDFGCGSAELLLTLYANRIKFKKYIGLDIRDKTINKLTVKYKQIKNAEFHTCNLLEENDIANFRHKATLVTSFEVIEHIGKNNGNLFMKHFAEMGFQNALYFLSTPVFSKKVGAARNHTFDSGDGRGVDVQEFERQEIIDLFAANDLAVLEKYGTFSSITDYSYLLSGWKLHMFNELKKYFDINILSNIMAVFFPEQSRNIIYKLKLYDIK